MNTIQKIPLTEGARYTIYSLSGIASTIRSEITVTMVLDEPKFAKSYVSYHRKPQTSLILGFQLWGVVGLFHACGDLTLRAIGNGTTAPLSLLIHKII